MAPEVKWTALGVETPPGNSLPGNAESKAAGTPESSKSVIQFYPDHGWPLVINKSDSIALEVFGILRSRLLKAWEKGMRSVLITSAGNGEGKSIIALNSALSLAQLGQKRVLLVDADLRASGITRFLGLRKGPGLSDYLRREQSLQAVIHTTSSRTLSIVPAGRTWERMLPELLEGSLWCEFIQIVKEQFDLIIVDSLPITAPFADLELLLAACDAFLVAMQIGKTLRASVKRVATCIDRQKFLGVIINNSDNIRDYLYGYEHYRERATARPVNDSCGLHQSTTHPSVPNALPSVPPSAMRPAPGAPVAAPPLASPIGTPAKQEAPTVSRCQQDVLAQNGCASALADGQTEFAREATSAEQRGRFVPQPCSKLDSELASAFDRARKIAPPAPMRLPVFLRAERKRPARFAVAACVLALAFLAAISSRQHIKIAAVRTREILASVLASFASRFSALKTAATTLAPEQVLADKSSGPRATAIATPIQPISVIATDPDASAPPARGQETWVPGASGVERPGLPSFESRVGTVVVVQPHDDLRQICLRHLGAYNERLVREIRKLNPKLTDPDRIAVGQPIILPQSRGHEPHVDRSSVIPSHE